MASKYQLITSLYEHTLAQVTKTPAAWRLFLRSACRSYKCRFDEQILIYAQRPDANAVLDMERWNKNYGRWINRGATGIAVFDDEYNGNSRLKHYFDISDTYQRNFARPVPLWQMESQHESEVIESLENSFGELEDKSTLANAIIEAAKNAVDDDIADYLRDLMDNREGSSLEQLDEPEAEATYRNAVVSSVTYMLLTRCGISADEHAGFDDFRHLMDFDTSKTVNALGIATSDIAESCLREISATVLALQRQEQNQNLNKNQNRTFANTETPAHNVANKQNDERSVENGSVDISNRRRLPHPESILAGGSTRKSWQIRITPKEVPERSPQDTVRESADDRQIERTPDGNRTDGKRAYGTFGIADGGNAGSDRADESRESDAVGWDDEQYPRIGGGDNISRPDLRIKPLHTEEQLNILGEAEEEKPSAFAVSQQIIDEVLTSGSNEENSIHRIAAYFKKDHMTAANAEFLKEEYKQGGKGFIFDGNHVSVWFDESGMRIAVGDSVLTDNAARITWTQAARRTRELLDMGRYMPQSELDKVDGYEIKSLAEHLWYTHQDLATGYDFSFLDKEIFKSGFPDSTAKIAEILEQPKEREKIIEGLREFSADYEQNPELLRFRFSAKHLRAALTGLEDLKLEPLVFTADESVSSARPSFITQDEIDRVLTGSGNVENGRYRIYSFFLQNHTAKEKADFLKHEYGTGGSGRTGFNEWHDSKGIAYSRENKHMPYDKVILPWPKVAKRIDELISGGRYMSQRQLDYLPEYEKEELAGEIYSFFPRQPEDLARPFPYGTDYMDGKKIIRPQLDEPDRVAEILSMMAAVLDNTADFDRDYESMKKAFLDLIDYQNGTYSLFTPVHKPTEEKQSEKVKPAEHVPKPAVATNAEYDLQLGATVHFGIEEFEICSFDDTRVVLRDMSAPLLTRDMPREEFDRKLRESRLNDGLIKADDMPKLETESEPEPESEPEEPQTKQEEILTPLWEKPKPRSQSHTFEPHPKIPMSKRHNYRITDDDLGAGGTKTKYKGNVEAIRTLQTIESENRFATPEEQEALAHYVGWGGLAEMFDENKAAWTNEYAELKSLLSPEEYDSARASTLNAHYTSPVVIKAIYKAVENMGFKTGNILEPSCGIGNFFGLVPESMSESKLFGVELDSLTGRIARQLYQKNNIAINGYENVDLPDSFFDLAIGNVPFGDYSVIDKRYDKHKFHIHDYFFAKTLDKVRPGGIIAFVTSKGTMDKQNPAVRKYIAQRADLIGAIRLPNDTFRRNAGTEVTTDIIFLQKRDRIIDIEPEWVHLGQTENGIPVNSYFAGHPDMILGTMSNDDGVRMYGAKNSTTCLPFPDADLSEQLNDAIVGIHAEITEYERGEDDPEEDNAIPADPNIRNFSYTLVGGRIYYRQDSRMVPVELPVTTQNRVKGMIALRECVRNLIMYQTDGYPDSDIRSEQAKLNRLYDDYTRKYGLINSRGNSIAFSQDSAYCLLCSLEVLDENGALERKADMFTKRTIKPHQPVTHVDTASEALAVSMSEKARVDLRFMTELTGMSEETLIKELDGVIFLNIGMSSSLEDVYVTADEYLSGNIREKLALAKAAQQTFPDGRYDTNVRALEAVQPQDLTAAEITVRLGATWLPEDVVERFMYELLQPSGYAHERMRVHYSQYTGEWNITEKTADRSNVHSFNTYGTQRMNAYRIIEESLNLRDVRIFDKVIDANGDEKRVLNKKETAIAQAKQEVIRTKFEEWVYKDPDRRERLCRIYNDRFNSIRPREYDGSHIKFVGMNPEITLQKHQVDAVAHILYGGNTLLAHEVGAGKTYEMVAAAMESKRLGLCNKSLIVVPNHITEQWAAEFLQLYPSANILVATKKDFETKNRKKFCARIATGDYDAVIIGHSQFEKIPMSAERQQKMLERQINELIDGIDEVKRNKGERFTIKQMEKAKRNLEVKLAKLNDQSKKDDVVMFEELGIDRLFIDESHYFKNLYLITKMRNVAGIAQTEAQKSSDLFMKTQYLDELTGGRGTIFATGTPLSNSMVELYTIQRYLQHSLLVEKGLQHFDGWASTFGETVTAIELAPEGTGYRAKTRFAKFFNLPELMSMFRRTADIQTADMLSLPVPKANFHTEVIKPSKWQQDMVAELAQRAEKIRNREVDSSVDNMLCVTNDGRKLALDQRIINPLLSDDPDGKVSTCADKVFSIWEKTKDKRSAQLIFSDLSTPNGKKQRDYADDADLPPSFTNVYDDIRKKLIAKGIPEKEIAFIHDADTEAKKKELFAKVRKGHVRIMLGSTQKMGAGTNCQDRLIALHDLDCPWRPADLAQRLGRIVRQGNKNPEVEVFRYVTESTFDLY